MSDISLFRKYRPNNFEALIGQNHVKTTLINAICDNRVSHAYLFTGPRGTGKTSTARLIACALNCQNLRDGFDPCNECDLCREIKEGRLIDLIEIDAASNRGIDEVRDLKEKINFAPTRSKYKIYIIDEVHMMTTEAFNALLKTLEEPPAHVYFILATTEAHKIPETIISRCQRFDFRRIKIAEIILRLQNILDTEKIDAEAGVLEIIARYVDGGLRDAIVLIEQLVVDGKISLEKTKSLLGINENSFLTDFCEDILNQKYDQALKKIDQLHLAGSDIKQFQHEILEIWRLKLLEQVEKNNKSMTGKIIKIIELIQEAGWRYYPPIPQLAMEMAVIKISELDQELDPNSELENPKFEPVKKVPFNDRGHQKIAQENKTIEIEAISLSQIKIKWEEMIARVKTPALKNSLKQALPATLEGINLTLEFPNNFHMEKVMKDHHVEFETLLKEVLNTALRILAVVKESPKIAYQEKVEEPDLSTENALEIFGGEVIERD